MANRIFESLLKEKIDQFKSSFSLTSKEVFYDEETNCIFHKGEYGTYRETIVRDFLQFIVPRGLDISTGFLITTMDDVSTQCDVVIFDSKMTPIYEEGDRQRFFPVESVHCIGEVKSTLDKTQFKDAINKLALNKALGERMLSPTIINKSPYGPFDPLNHPYDLIPSFLICQKLNFNISSIENDIDSLYEPKIEHRHKHNMILSIEDGLLAYFDSNNKTLPYSRLKKVDLKNRFTSPGENKDVHFKLFASYMFTLTASKTLFYPDISDYMGSIKGGTKRDQVQPTAS